MRDEIPKSVIESHVKKAATSKTVKVKDEPMTGEDAPGKITTGFLCNTIHCLLRRLAKAEHFLL